MNTVYDYIVLIHVNILAFIGRNILSTESQKVL